MTVVRRSRSRYRERSSARRMLRWVVALLALVVALGAGSVLVQDLRVDRALSHRGVAATGHLDATSCLFCRAVGVTFTTASGQSVSAVVSAIGPQADATISLKYDPLHPTDVHPAHGVREEEAIALALLLIAVVVLLRRLGLRRRRGRRVGPRVRTRGGASHDMAGHVRIFRDH